MFGHDLPWCAWKNLAGEKYLSFDQPPHDSGADAQSLGSFLKIQPGIVLSSLKAWQLQIGSKRPHAHLVQVLPTPVFNPNRFSVKAISSSKYSEAIWRTISTA